MEAVSLKEVKEDKEILNDQEPLESNGIGACPIFYPTETEFKDFQGYLEKCVK